MRPELFNYLSGQINTIFRQNPEAAQPILMSLSLMPADKADRLNGLVATILEGKKELSDEDGTDWYQLLTGVGLDVSMIMNILHQLKERSIVNTVKQGSFFLICSAETRSLAELIANIFEMHGLPFRIKLNDIQKAPYGKELKPGQVVLRIKSNWDPLSADIHKLPRMVFTDVSRTAKDWIKEVREESESFDLNDPDTRQALEQVIHAKIEQLLTKE